MRELGPDEGMNALRHPDCRFCDEYERLLRGVKAENDQLKQQGDQQGGDASERNADQTGHAEATRVAEPGVDVAGARPEISKQEECDGSGQIPTGECLVAMSGPTCMNPDCPPCQTPETDPCPGCPRCQSTSSTPEETNPIRTSRESHVPDKGEKGGK